MKKKALLITVVVFSLVLLGAGMLYRGLADKVTIGSLATTPAQPRETQPQQTQSPEAQGETSAPEETEAPDYSAPDFTMLDGEGNEVSLLDFVGKPIILNFWASWCGPCKMEMPDIQKAYETYGEEIHFLIVNCTDGSRETVDTAKDFLAGQDYTFPVYFDTTSMGAYTYGASCIPLTFFINAEGNLEAYYMGAMSESILQKGIEMIYTPAQ